jgi:hypothetical protein
LKFEDVFSVSTSFPRHHLCVEGGEENNIETKTKEQKANFNIQTKTKVSLHTYFQKIFFLTFDLGIALMQ